MGDLGAIEKVDLREVWPNEASDFTPWLSENLDKLGDALGLDLELQSAEAPVGAFSLDVLAHDLGSNRPVIIENQLEATNHSHLGQLLTYAAGFDAYAAVWLTRDFRDEHRQALDWLNQRTDEDTAFYGVVVEALRIDDSRPAPHFRVVAAPNDWQKHTSGVTKAGPTDTVSERGERFHEFFQGLVDTMREKHQFTNSRKAGYRQWCSFSSGFSGVRYNPCFVYSRNIARVEVYIGRNDTDWNKQLFDRLESRKESLESELRGIWEWQRLDNRKACRISVISRDVNIDDDDESLDELREWMVDKLLALKRVFGPHLAELVE